MTDTRQKGLSGGFFGLFFDPILRMDFKKFQRSLQFVDLVEEYLTMNGNTLFYDKSWI